MVVPKIISDDVRSYNTLSDHCIPAYERRCSGCFAVRRGWEDIDLASSAFGLQLSSKQ